MKKFLLFPLLVIVFLSGYFLPSYVNKPEVKIPVVKPRPLDKYAIENLAKTPVPSVDILVGDTLTQNKDFTSAVFSFEFDPTLTGKENKKVTGVINVPTKPGKYPVVVMFRGFVDQKIYQPGVGTQRDADYFAKNFLITLAPDFLGYGGSDKESTGIFESRFQTYTTAMTVLASVKNIPQWDGKNIFIWGHSNGGQIALTVLEITGKAYPTILWAPVSAAFPYSILYYTDEPEDKGKYLRKELAKFEEDYNTDLYSIHKYWGNITAPLRFHQGTADEAVPVAWTTGLNKTLQTLKIDTHTYLYSGADHNLQPQWNKAIIKSLEFFEERRIND